MKKQEKEKLSHFMCFKCHEVGHLAKWFPQWREAQIEERRREAKACQMLQVPHMGSSHLYVPNQTISEATSEVSTKATSWAR
jgi:hypothetical protein